jgi:hypothetical protein
VRFRFCQSRIQAQRMTTAATAGDRLTLLTRTASSCASALSSLEPPMSRLNDSWLAISSTK